MGEHFSKPARQRAGRWVDHEAATRAHGSPGMQPASSPPPGPCLPTPAQVAANHVRPDGSTFHIVEYNPNTGAVNKKYTYQGHATNSTWARGQAWALAGFAMLATATGEEEFAAVGRRVADTYLERMARQPLAAAAPGLGSGGADGLGGAAPGVAAAAAVDEEAAEEEGGGGGGGGAWDGFVPVWDFDAPHHPDLDGPRDTSAAAVAALGLLHLSEACARAGGPAGAECASRYLCAATNTLRALASDKYLSPASEVGFPALLRHATGGFPLGSHVDVGLISGDYYFLSALAKCAAMPDCLAS
jgi:unsaturated chondroitin disaccharide hydrolase